MKTKREKILDDYNKGVKVKEICLKYNITIQTLYKYYIKSPSRYKKHIEIKEIKPIEIPKGIFNRYEEDFYSSYLSLTMKSYNEDDVSIIKEIMRISTPKQAKSILIYLAYNYPDKVNLQTIFNILDKMQLKTKTQSNKKDIKYKSTGKRQEKIGSFEDFL